MRGRCVQLLAVLALSLLVPTAVSAGRGKLGEESISLTMIERLRASFAPTEAESRLIDAVIANPVKEIALNQEVIRNHNKLFSHEIKTGQITDQKSTGRCWLYAALNVLRPAVLEKVDMQDFEFSQNYLYFWDKMEKANTFLENVIARAGLDLRDEKFQRILKNPVEE